jgi:succinate dehydrogenase / fumarate reductase cytochrome b subunit
MGTRRRYPFNTTVGTKVLIALTGLALVGFLIFHLYGNVILIFGAEKYNEHAHALIANPLIIPAEIGLLAIFLLHAIKAILNFFHNRPRVPSAMRSRNGPAAPAGSRGDRPR